MSNMYFYHTFHAFFKNSDYLHWILKEKSNEMEFCLTFEKIPIMFFFYSENLPLHKSTQKFFKNSSKKGGRFCVDPPLYNSQGLIFMK